MSKALQEQAKVLETKRGELAEIFKKHKSDSGYDMDESVIAEVNKRNDELTELGKKYEGAKAAHKIADENEKALEDLSRTPERKIGFPGGGNDRERGKPEQKSLGDLLVESKAFKEVSGGRGPSANMPDVDVKTLFSRTAGWDPQVVRSGVVVLTAQQQPKVIDLIPMTETGQAGIKYMEETTFTNAAAETAEGGTYPESALQLTERLVPVQKISTFLPMTDEQLEDEPRTRDYVNNRLQLMLRQRLDTQLLNGNGTAPNLKGFLNVTGIQTQPKGTDPVPDAVYKAMVLIQTVAFADPSAVIFNPLDWQNVRLLRTTQGLYIWGNPSEAGPERIWGLPIVRTTFLAQGTALVGDYANYSEFSVRRGIEMQISNSHGTYFIEGKQAIRMDMRGALVVYRPKAFATVTGL